MMAMPGSPQSFTLSSLLDGKPIVTQECDRAVASLSLDSRAVDPGDVFCALSGTRGHGLEFASAAIARGAVAVLAEPDATWDETAIVAQQALLGVPVYAVPGLSLRISALAGRLYGDPGADLDLIAVTGTNGKTSVCRFLAQAMDGERPCAMVGTLGYGFPGSLADTTHTTPDAIRLQAMLAELKARGAAAVAMEVSSHALDQGRVAALPVDTAVFTNLTRDHLDYHADMAAYAKAKQGLFRMPGLRQAVLNLDDPFGQVILDALDAGIETVVTSINPAWLPPQGDVHWLQAVHIDSGLAGMRVQLHGTWGKGEFTTGLLGRFNVSNLLAVLAVLLLRGYGLEQAIQALEDVGGVPGRMERFGNLGQPLVVVDYAHTPDALEQVLSVLREHGPRRLICLFGCGGERDRGKRPQMGAVAERLSDLLILTDDNPRGEDGKSIINEILSGMQNPHQALVQSNRGRAIRHGVCMAGPGDILLVAGKGHETTQEMGELRILFSDRAQVTQALNERGGCV